MRSRVAIAMRCRWAGGGAWRLRPCAARTRHDVGVVWGDCHGKDTTAQDPGHLRSFTICHRCRRSPEALHRPGSPAIISSRSATSFACASGHRGCSCPERETIAYVVAGAIPEKMTAAAGAGAARWRGAGSNRGQASSPRKPRSAQGGARDWRSKGRLTAVALSPFLPFTAPDPTGLTVCPQPAADAWRRRNSARRWRRGNSRSV